MSMPPPPGNGPPPPQGFPGQQPPIGYQPYGQPPQQQKTNGMSIASLVLSLVNIIPCFWFLPLPALLGVIFGFVGRSQIAKSNGSAKGNGLAVAGLVVGLVFLAIGVIFWIYVATSDNCYRDGSSFRCV